MLRNFTLMYPLVDVERVGKRKNSIHRNTGKFLVVLSCNLLVLMVLGTFGYSQKGKDSTSTFSWFPERLRMDDFKMTPPANTPWAAITTSKIIFKSNSFGVKHDSLRFEVTALFVGEKSWMRIRDSIILNHEQGHFDITELYARRMRKEIQEFEVSSANMSELEKIIKKIMNAEGEYQASYDSITKHGVTAIKQMEMDSLIASELMGLENYKETTMVKKINHSSSSIKN